MYDIDFKKLISWLIPPVLKSNHLPILLNAFIAPIKNTYRSFIQFKTESEYRLSNNSQVCYLTKVLNDRFDLDKRQIIITDSSRYTQLYVYPAKDGKDVFLGEEFIRPKTDFADTGVDFTVILPENFRIDENEMYEMKSLINSYKLAGKRYKIVYN